MSDAPVRTDQSSAWNWPAEWAVERAFWREVAARTLAGILTLVFLGLPGVIYAMAAGVLTVPQVMPIVIGVGIFLGLLLGYVIAQLIVRGVARRRIVEALGNANVASFGVPVLDPFGLVELSVQVLRSRDDEERRQLLVGFSTAAQQQAIDIARRAARAGILLGVAAAAAGIVSLLAPLFP